MNNHVVERLRKGSWDYAVLFVKGMQPMELQKKGDRKYIIEDDWLVLTGNRVPSPFSKPSPPVSNTEVPAPVMTTVDIYVHLEEIVSAQFYQDDLKSPLIKV